MPNGFFLTFHFLLYIKVHVFSLFFVVRLKKRPFRGMIWLALLIRFFYTNYYEGTRVFWAVEAVLWLVGIQGFIFEAVLLMLHAAKLAAASRPPQPPKKAACSTRSKGRKAKFSCMFRYHFSHCFFFSLLETDAGKVFPAVLFQYLQIPHMEKCSMK